MHGTTTSYRHGCRCAECREAHRSAEQARRWRKYGKPPTPLTPEERLWSRIAKSDGCWEWTGHLNDQGYGYIRWEGREQPAHRVVLSLSTRSTIPNNLQVDHLCRNRRCCNPSHLEVVTPAENTHRAPFTRLSRMEVLQIREAVRTGEPHRSIAKRFRVSAPHVTRIGSGEVWASA